MSPWLLWGESRRRAFEGAVTTRFAGWCDHWVPQRGLRSPLDWVTPVATLVPGLIGAGVRVTDPDGGRLCSVIIVSDGMYPLLGIPPAVRVTLSFNARSDGSAARGIVTAMAHDLIGRLGQHPRTQIDAGAAEEILGGDPWPRGTATCIAWAN